MTDERIFESIYLNQKWGRTRNLFRRFLPKRLYSGPGSHDPKFTRPYWHAVRQWIEANGPFESAMDIGCGDFAVGCRLQPAFKQYLGVDVSPSIIEQSAKTYRRPGLEFRCAQGKDASLPMVDVVFIRQVFQHLSNADTQEVLANIVTKAKWLIVTEDVHADYEANPNQDMPTGPGNRLDLKSGVQVGVAPFDLGFTAAEVICEVQHKHGKVVTTCLKIDK